MKKTSTIILLGAAVLFLLSCAASKPARFEGGAYINPNYEVLIRPPVGWHVTEEIPDWFKKNLSREQNRLIIVQFFNRKTNGVISVACDKGVGDVYNFTPRALMLAVENKLEEQKKKATQNQYIKKYVYELNEPAFWDRSWRNPSHVATTNAISQSEFQEFKEESRIFLYSCKTDDNCVLEINLLSDARTFDGNYPALESVVSSIEKYQE